jgi:hypothetical protein
MEMEMEYGGKSYRYSGHRVVKVPLKSRNSLRFLLIPLSTHHSPLTTQATINLHSTIAAQSVRGYMLEPGITCNVVKHSLHSGAIGHRNAFAKPGRNAHIPCAANNSPYIAIELSSNASKQHAL